MPRQTIIILSIRNTGNQPLPISVGPIDEEEVFGTDVTPFDGDLGYFDGSGLAKIMPGRAFEIEEYRVDLGQIQNFIDSRQAQVLFLERLVVGDEYFVAATTTLELSGVPNEVSELVIAAETTLELSGIASKIFVPGPPNFAQLQRHWDAATPLLSAEGDEVVYTQVGAPTLGTTQGLASVEFTARSQGYSSPGITAIDSATQNVAIYCLIEWTAADQVNNSQGYLSRIGSGVFNGGKRMHLGLNTFGDDDYPFVAGYDNSALLKPGTLPTVLGAGPTAHVISMFWDATAKTIACGIDGVLGTPSAAFNNTIPVDEHHWVGDAYPALGDSTWMNTPLMHALVYSGVGMAHDEGDVVAYLLGLV